LIGRMADRSGFQP